MESISFDKSRRAVAIIVFLSIASRNDSVQYKRTSIVEKVVSITKIAFPKAAFVMQKLNDLVLPQSVKNYR